MYFFKKISLFLTYRTILKSISKELEIEYNCRVDNIYRIYSVLNIPEELFEEPYNLRKSDIETLSRNYVTEYRRSISTFLVSKGLMELFDIYEIRKVDKYSYLLIFGFSLFNTKKIANNFITTLLVLIPTSLISILGWILYKTLT